MAGCSHVPFLTYSKECSQVVADGGAFIILYLSEALVLMEFPRQQGVVQQGVVL